MSFYIARTHTRSWGCWRWDVGGLLHGFLDLQLSPREYSLLIHQENAFVLTALLPCTDITGSSVHIR